MKYIIYKITNTVNGKVYIGKHQTINPNDGYMGSGIAIEKAIKKYGRDAFLKEILFTFDNENDMDIKEREIVNEEFVSRRDTYNKALGGEGGSNFKGKKHSDETKAKLSALARGRVHSVETRKRISDGNRRRTISDETKKKLSEKAKQRYYSDEYKIKHSLRMKEWHRNKNRELEK